MATLSASQIAALAYQAGFRGQDIAIAVAVALAESSGRTDAVNHNTNGSVDEGLMQINSVHTELTGNRFDPATNMRMAYAIKTRRGSWKDWSTFNSGRYAIFMPTATAAARGIDKTIPVTLPAGNVDSSVQSSSSSGFGKLSDPHTWLRVATVLAGGVLVLAALALLGWDNAPDTAKSVAKTAVKTAAKAAVVA